MSTWSLSDAQPKLRLDSGKGVGLRLAVRTVRRERRQRYGRTQYEYRSMFRVVDAAGHSVFYHACAHTARKYLRSAPRQLGNQTQPWYAVFARQILDGKYKSWLYPLNNSSDPALFARTTSNVYDVWGAGVGEQLTSKPDPLVVALIDNPSVSKASPLSDEESALMLKFRAAVIKNPALFRHTESFLKNTNAI